MAIPLDPSLFPQVQSLPALLSGAQLLNPIAPSISGAFIRYASALIENQLAQNGSNSSLDTAFSPFRKFSSSSACASARELERFGDGLIAAVGGSFAVDFIRLAYLCYAACSLHGELPARVRQKLEQWERRVVDSGNTGTLAKLALAALQAGADNIAYSALYAAATEARKGGK
jgi:hypothetical protein